jgi:N-acetylmuramic acid 6-phosphate etherase
MLGNLTTEARNPASELLDRLSPLEIVELINKEDRGIADAVGREAPAIAQAIEVIAERLSRGGRLVYFGAGTSGRLGVLDAVECVPTFNAPKGQVIGLIAGGYDALTRSIEGAEDHPEYAVVDLQDINLSAADAVVGIASSGRTPYVVSGLQYARAVGAYAIGLSCNRDAALSNEADLNITPVVGPEVLSGSTRMKAGTATKMVLNMISTGAMVQLGKTFGNLMIDLRATNEKLHDRALRIVRMVTTLPEEDAAELLTRCGGEVKTAILAHHGPHAPEEARRRLSLSGGRLAAALENGATKSADTAVKNPADQPA